MTPSTENRTGKTSFLRLLLDTSAISPRASKDQLASVTRFVQGHNGHTSYIRAVSIDITLDVDGPGQYEPLGLTLIDALSLNEAGEVRLLSETIRQIDSRFAEGIEDVGAYSLSPLSAVADMLPRLRPETVMSTYTFLLFLMLENV